LRRLRSFTVAHSTTDLPLKLGIPVERIGIVTGLIRHFRRFLLYLSGEKIRK
jgi:hypothetical protein